MQKLKEMKEIMRVEETKFKVLESDVEKVLNNAFIKDCDEYGIKKYERLLGIIIMPEDSLESRKSRVQLYWNNEIPYTYRTLIRQLNVYCGVNNYDIDADLKNYDISFSIYGKVDLMEIESFLEKILPENIMYHIFAATEFLGKGRNGIVWQEDEIFTLRQVIL